MDHPFTFGIEEEFFLADASSRGSPESDSAECFHRQAQATVHSASRELLKSQTEVQTEPGVDFDQARDWLATTRRRLADAAAAEGLGLFAAGTHPLASPREQEATEKPRYLKLSEEFGIISQRAMVCAMHIHVSVPEPDRRISLVNRLIPLLPLFLALSVSSPFWEGRRAGLKGFRLTAFSEWPRMGIPEIFRDDDAYQRFVACLTNARFVENASFIWWYVRPSIHFPTIELRICDSCTHVDDAVAIAALYRATVRALVRRPDTNADVSTIDRAVCAENIWQVQRRGLDADVADPGSGAAVPVRRRLAALIDMVEEDAHELRCSAWLSRVCSILERGTSADHQLKHYDTARSAGRSQAEACRDVVDMLVRGTVA